MVNWILAGLVGVGLLWYWMSGKSKENGGRGDAGSGDVRVGVTVPPAVSEPPVRTIHAAPPVTPLPTNGPVTPTTNIQSYVFQGPTRPTTNIGDRFQSNRFLSKRL